MSADEQGWLRPRRSRRRGLLLGALALGGGVGLYFGLSATAGLAGTWERVRRGDPAWLALAAALEAASFWGHIALFRAVFAQAGRRIGWRESYEITLAGFAATRLFAAGGAGGVALTAWALRRAGLEVRAVAAGMTAFLAILYGVYLAAVVVCGTGLAVLGDGPAVLTTLPAALGAALIAAMALVGALPRDVETRLARWARGRGRPAQWARRAAPLPGTAAVGLRHAAIVVRERPVAVVGALAWWGFDVGVLWAAFHAFGDPPGWGVLVMAYFVGLVGNLLPLPGGVGGVDGGMIGCLIAFGVIPGLAVLGVLAYRIVAFLVPTPPGVVAYLQLRRTVHAWDAAPATGP